MYGALFIFACLGQPYLFHHLHDQNYILKNTPAPSPPTPGIIIIHIVTPMEGTSTDTDKVPVPHGGNFLPQ